MRIVERLPRGLGAVLRETGGRVQSGGSALRMEVEAVVQVLRLLRTEWAELGEVVIALDAKALVRWSRGDPMMGMVLLEQSALLRELERWLGRPVRWVWVKSHRGDVHQQPGGRDCLPEGV